MELTELAADGEAAGTFFDVPDDLGIDIEALGDGNDLFRILGTYIDFEAVAAIEDLVHLAPVGTTFFSDDAEEGWHREHVILHYAAVVAHEV